MERRRNVAIMIFEEVEVLDFAGPFEVFNVTAELNDPAPFNVYLVAETSAPVKTRGKLSINPNYNIYTMPPADVLLIPGGAGSRALLKKSHVIEWLQAQAGQVEFLCSVCTGALVLGKAGLLKGLRATTHHDNLDDLRRLVDDSTMVVETVRYVDNGHILTSGGVSAGIDMSLYLVKKILGDEVLRRTLDEMEYPWSESTELRWKA